jgi:dTDP-4-dehydrorhamnose reductase
MNASPPKISPLEIWGGFECSRVRLPGRVEDQIARTGHDQRVEDIDRIASLGLRTVRYPILWERHAGQPTDWSWADERLNRLRALGIRPIVGFIHHGSGPLPDGLLDPGLATGLADFARRFAQRYPWVDAFTPINEPLTTARFSGLYGLWHPFRTDAKNFARVMLNECAAIRAAMTAIREVTPHAQLIQTEDIGKTHSTEFLAYQADFENERRWLTFDLLCGKLVHGHPTRKHLLAAGLSAAELESFVREPCPPDVLGVNYYVTSERFLDERVQRYPRECRGGNEHQVYADIHAVRVRAEGLCGPAFLLRELWHRYRRPIAVTEVQIACTREEQLRWLHEIWSAAQELRGEQIDVRAITAWALLGAYDWDSLLLEARGHYESGAFDCRSTPPRPTAVARALRDLATKGDFNHPALPGPGWWRRPFRFEFPAVRAPRTGTGTAFPKTTVGNTHGRPLLILGATGTLGGALVRICEWRGLHVVGLSRRDFDLTAMSKAGGLIERFRPWAVINATGYVRVDEAESDPSSCLAVNATACARLAAACAEHDVRFVTFSSNFVFDGAAMRPYIESDPPAPLNHYGRSKFAAEQAVTRLGSDALIIRTSAFFGPWSQRCFAPQTLERLRQGGVVQASEEVVISPTYIPDLVNATLDLLIDGEKGIWHAANQGAVSWHGWARLIAKRLGVPGDRVVAASPEELGWVAARPRYAVLGSERGLLLPHWEKAMDRFLAERVPAEQHAEAARI